MREKREDRIEMVSDEENEADGCGKDKTILIKKR